MADLNIPEFLQDYGADFSTMLQGWAGLLIGCIAVMLISAMYAVKYKLEDLNKGFRKRSPNQIKPWGPWMGLLLIRGAYFGATIGGALIEVSLDKAALTWAINEFLPAVIYFVLFFLVTEFIAIVFMHKNSPLNLVTVMEQLKQSIRS